MGYLNPLLKTRLRAINVLHSICVFYYYYYYHYYNYRSSSYYYSYYYHYRCFFFFLQLTAIMGEASSGLLSFSLSCVFDISSFASKKKTLVPATQAMIGNDKGPTLERVCACQSTVRTWRGQTRGGGHKGSFVLHWFFYNEFEDAQSRHLRKFQTMINSSTRKLHYGPL